MPAENLWRVEIVNAASDENDENGKKAVWHSINSQVNEHIFCPCNVKFRLIERLLETNL